ncbi:hypothetical protein EDC94DRAFT_389325 [Helicostylum pulchrum]|nr:hypothetical protein EDC94DRAFT_389325 [Helicostylum pulchrum]
MPTIERNTLLPNTITHNYASIIQDPETGNSVIIQKEKKEWLWTSNSYTWSLATLILLLLTFSALEYALLELNLPAVNPEDKDDLKFPRNLQDLRRLNAILSVYIDQHFINVYITFVGTYI